MKKFKDIKGQKFGRLVALERHSKLGERTKWLCKCECGKRKTILLSSLVSGRSKSCGCMRKEMVGKKFRKHGFSNKHGTLYTTWSSMRSRCITKTNPAYKNYGARGIKVCEEWDDFENFLGWAENNGYKKGLTLDRINNDGGYSPDNCRWADIFTQANNKRTNVYTEINGVVKTLSQHAKDNNINYFTLHNRYHEIGLRGKELLSPSKKKTRTIEIDGVSKTIYEWADEVGISKGAISYRYDCGIRGMDILRPTNKKRLKGVAY